MPIYECSRPPSHELELLQSARKASSKSYRKYARKLASAPGLVGHPIVLLCITDNCFAGLAVSGGVDSMALASLCSRSNIRGGHAPYFTSLIVDHQARPGSGVEAEKVAETLRSLSMPSTMGNHRRKYSQIHRARSSCSADCMATIAAAYIFTQFRDHSTTRTFSDLGRGMQASGYQQLTASPSRR